MVPESAESSLRKPQSLRGYRKGARYLITSGVRLANFRPKIDKPCVAAIGPSG
jgi:hypothetical protein